MKWFHADIGSTQATLEQRPEVFHPVCMDSAVNVPLGMIDDLVDVLLIQSGVRPPLISENVSAFFDTSTNTPVQGTLVALFDDFRGDSAATFQHPHDYGFASDTALLEALPNLLGLMHITRKTADKGFVNLNFAAVPSEFYDSAFLQSAAKAMHHEPSTFLRDAEIARNLVGTDSIFTVNQHPKCGKPFIQAKWAVLEDRAELDGKLLVA